MFAALATRFASYRALAMLALLGSLALAIFVQTTCGRRLHRCTLLKKSGVCRFDQKSTLEET
jgi:hypothetical protein